MLVNGTYPRALHALMAVLATTVLLSSFLLQPSVSAQGIKTVGNGSAGSCSEAALDAALNGGGTIVFNCGPNPITIRLNTGKKIVANTTIDGGSKITLDGQNTVRQFYVNANYRPEGVPFTIRNISLVNGKSSGNDSAAGGCLYNRQSVVTVENVTFNNCVANQGGGVYNYKGTITISDSTFTNNRAANDGGGLAAPGNGGTVNIYNSTFNGNRAELNGGGVFIIGGFLNVANSLFENNEAVAQVQFSGIGGGIYTDKDPTIVNVTGTRFVNNKAYEGGGLFADRGTTLTMSYSEFVGNRTTQRSGGFGAFEAKVYVSNSTFRENSSFEGGGIYTGSPASISEFTNITVTNNRAGGDGGGMYHRQGIFLLRDSLLSDNSAGQDLLGDKRGGGIVIYDGTNTIVNTTIANNRIDGNGAYGGGVASNGNLDLINATIVNNRASRGGGIYINRNATEVLNTTLSNNTATSGRTLARGSNGTITIKNSILSSAPSGNSKNCEFSASAFTDRGNNVQWGDTTCFPGKLNVDPLVTGLGDYGGPTPTVGLGPGSPAIDGADGSVCPTTDQRGFLRNTQCDIGAFESGSVGGPPVTNYPPRVWLPVIRRR
jgi:predicted outer membrane repeat protein